MRAQTSTEYVIIVAVVIVIALVVTLTLGKIGGMSVANSGNLEWQSAEIGIVSFVAQEGNESLELKNNYGVSVDLEKVLVNTSQDNLDDSNNRLPIRARFAVGQRKTINLGNIVDCTNGEEVTLYLKLEFLNVKNQGKFNTTINRPYSTKCAAAVAAISESASYSFTKVDAEDAAGFAGSCSSPANAYDENYATYATGACTIYENFTKPSGVANAILETKLDSGIDISEVHFRCWNSSTWITVLYEYENTLRTLNTSIPSACISGSQYRMQTIIDPGSDIAHYYEGAVWWNATS